MGYANERILLPKLVDSDSETFEKEPYDWKDDDYWSLPENVRHAIDKANQNQKYSPFYYKL